MLLSQKKCLRKAKLLFSLKVEPSAQPFLISLKGSWDSLILSVLEIRLLLEKMNCSVTLPKMKKQKLLVFIVKDSQKAKKLLKRVELSFHEETSNRLSRSNQARQPLEPKPQALTQALSPEATLHTRRYSVRHVLLEPKAWNISLNFSLPLQKIPYHKGNE